MGCCSGLMKYILFGLNLLFWLAGVAILGVGIWLKVDPSVSNIFVVAGVSLNAGAITFIVLGCVMFVIGFCGCCGAIKESKCLLGIYFTFVLVILIAQLVVGIWGFVSRSSIEEWIRTGLNATTPIDTGNADEVAAVKNLQSIFECCGLLNCTDWPNGQTSGCSCSVTAVTASTCINASSISYCSNADNPEQGIYSTDL